MKTIFGLLKNNINEVEFFGEKYLKTYQSKNYISHTASLVFKTYEDQIDNIYCKNNVIIISFGSIYISSKPIKNDSIYYEYKKGTNFLSNIHGKFLLIIIDLNENRSFYKTDKFGLVPLYYFSNNKNFIFGTNIDNIINLIGKDTIDDIKVSEFLQLSNCSPERTFFSSIKKLNSKNTMIVDHSKCNRITFKKDIIKSTRKNDDGKEVFNIFQSMHNFNYLSNINNVGLIFSGGIDSSATLAALKNVNKNLNVYSMSFTYPFRKKKLRERSCENDKQKNLSKVFNTFHIEIPSDQINPFDHIEKNFKAFNQPIFFPNSYIFHESCAKAKSKNLKYLFSGVGGDSIVSWGYESLRDSFFKFRFTEVQKNISKLAKIRNISKKNIIQYVFLSFYKEKIIYFINNCFGFMGIHFRVNSILKKKFVKNTKIYKKNNLNLPLTASKYHEHVINAHDHEINNEKVFHIFNFYEIEHEMPFYNEQLANYCLNTKSKYKLKNGIERFYFRKSLEGYLDKKIIYDQSKADLSTSFLLNFVKKGQYVVENEINHLHLYLDKILEKDSIESLLRIFDAPTKDILKKEGDIINLYNIYVLNVWLKNNDKYLKI